MSWLRPVTADTEFAGNFADLSASCLNPLVLRDALGKTRVAGYQPCDADTDQRERYPIGLQHLADAGVRACLELRIHIVFPFRILRSITRTDPESRLRPRATSSMSAA